MIDCIELRETMADRAHGLGQWTVEESAHLEQCAECAREWRVVQAGAALFGTLSVDGNRIADRVVARLLEPPAVPMRIWPRRAAIFGLAAAACLALVLIWPHHRAPAVGAAADTAVALIPELQDLSDQQLDQMVQSVGNQIGRAHV